ncbi:histidine--tRNA ligase [Fundidesulfovibrio butyratiphilus]
MDKIQKIKGFADLLPDQASQFARLETVAKTVFGRYGYREIRLPILERTELFARSIGEETDVVQKEMYTFPDRKGRSLTMRPEATAGVMRAYIENNMHAAQELSKLYCTGPMFRYERPQKGRMRQFHQLDVEAVGSPSPYLDAEMLFMLADFLGEIGLTDLSVELNSLGCPACRPAYQDALNAYFRGFDSGSLCEDCLRRKLTNPLRVLDCKVPGCRELTKGAPSLANYLCDECREHFAVVTGLLDKAGFSYVLNPRLVRGLDYYVRTTFEVVSGKIGSQSAVAGGGRYDGLVSALGGPELPGVGFACGMERLALLLGQGETPAPDFFIAALCPEALGPALELAQALRAQGLSGECALAAKSAKNQLRQAARLGAKRCLILGESELANNTVVVKDMATAEQTSLPRVDVTALLTRPSEAK